MAVSSLERNANFFSQLNLSKFLGQWVAVADRKVVAHGADLARVLAEARKNAPHSVPYVARIPEGTLAV